MKIEGQMVRNIPSLPLSFQDGVEASVREPELQEKGSEGKATSSVFLDPKKLRELGGVLKSLFEVFNLELRFKIHEPTKEIIARIVNRETGEVIREIPPEKFLDMVAKLQELAGVFVDELV